MSSRPTAAVWIGSAFCAALALTGLVLAALGPGERGTHVALQATARLSFLLFWPAYAGGALTALFGTTFQPLKQRAREFGLACFSASCSPRTGRLVELYWSRAIPRDVYLLWKRRSVDLSPCAALDRAPAANARAEGLAALAHRRSELHCLRLCRGFLEISASWRCRAFDRIFAI
jgi:hypothetical protein